MKYYAAVTYLSLVLGTASCASNKYVVVAPGFPKLRVASTEYRFTDSITCKNAAEIYYRKTSGNATMPTTANPARNIYTFRDELIFGKTKEVRFVVGPNGTKTGKKFMYLETTAASATDDVANEQAIRDYVLKLEKINFNVLMAPTIDPEVNGKKAWRAILYPGSSTSTLKYKGQEGNLFDFGIIINPPYPP